MKIATMVFFVILSSGVTSSCTPAINDTYIATRLNKTVLEPTETVSIKPYHDVTIRVNVECFPHGDGCRVVVWWFYPKQLDVKFQDGIFIARDINNHDIDYGSTSNIDYSIGGYGDNRDKMMEARVLVVRLENKLPKEFEFVMPRLNVNGVSKEPPVIRFKHVRRPGLTPFFMNY